MATRRDGPALAWRGFTEQCSERMRAQTGGLFLPIIAHLAADATIYGILVWAEAA